jgi:TolB-like protein
LPFANPDGDPELDHLALGIAEDLTSDLGRRPENLVIGSGTARSYRGQAVDARWVAPNSE